MKIVNYILLMVVFILGYSVYYYRSDLETKKYDAFQDGMARGKLELLYSLNEQLGNDVPNDKKSSAEHFVTVKMTNAYIVELNDVRTLTIFDE